jgi:hypothetical protein
MRSGGLNASTMTATALPAAAAINSGLPCWLLNQNRPSWYTNHRLPRSGIPDRLTVATWAGRIGSSRKPRTSKRAHTPHSMHWASSGRWKVLRYSIQAADPPSFPSEPRPWPRTLYALNRNPAEHSARAVATLHHQLVADRTPTILDGAVPRPTFASHVWHSRLDRALLRQIQQFGPELVLYSRRQVGECPAARLMDLGLLC